MIIPILLKSRNYVKLITCSHFLTYKKWMELEFEQEAVFQRLCCYLPCVMSGHSLSITGFIHLYWASQSEVASRVEDYCLEELWTFKFKRVRVQGDPQMMGCRRCICFHSVFQKDVKWFIFYFRNGPSLHFPFGLCYIFDSATKTSIPLVISSD